MSKVIIVLTPNGRRQKVQCTPDTSILQVLEDVCTKQGFQASDYDLKHHNHILDLTMTLRFSNLPNKAMLEMVELDSKRMETNVTIGLQLEDGERRTADFVPTTSLYELVLALAPSELRALEQPTISYMRQEVVGEIALKEKTLRQLGLIRGRAILRLLNKEEARQANVSSIYRKTDIETKRAETVTDKDIVMKEPAASERKLMSDDIKKTEHDDIKKDKNGKQDIIAQFKDNISKIKNVVANKVKEEEERLTVEAESRQVKKINNEDAMEVDSKPTPSAHPTQNLERRLKIEEEITFLGSHKAIVFMPDPSSEVSEDLPDDFYELSVEEVRSLYHDLQQSRMLLENTPLISASQKEEQNKQASLEKLKTYKNVVVRVQFPDLMILQGIFTPTNSIADVIDFIKEHLQQPSRKFHIYTTPLKEHLKPTLTLLEAQFVPCVHMHFKWLDDDTRQEPYLKESTYSKQTAPDAASLLASKYRAPTKSSNSSQSSRSGKPSTSKSNKTPRWFQN